MVTYNNAAESHDMIANAACADTTWYILLVVSGGNMCSRLIRTDRVLLIIRDWALFHEGNHLYYKEQVVESLHQ